MFCTDGPYLEPSETSKMEFFKKIINDWKRLTISAKPFHHVVITYIPSESCSFNPFQSYVSFLQGVGREYWSEMG